MKLKIFLLSISFGIGLIISTATMASGSIGEFQAIEQPLISKLSVTLIGLGLITLELWWFLAKRR